MTPQFVSPERIKIIAGSQAFEAGSRALGKQVVAQFNASASRVSAVISGYQVRLSYRADDAIDGACNCAASDGFEFCQHCVHLALHANKLAQQLLSLSKGPDKSKVLAYLLSLDKPELAKQMLSLIEQDKHQLKRYLLKASLVADGFDYAALKAEVTALTRLQEKLFSQRQVKHFFDRIERFLAELQLSDFQSEPESMLKVLEYLIARLNRVLLKVDDRANQRHQLTRLLQNLYTQLLMSLEVRPQTLARRHEKNCLLDQFAVLGGDVVSYLDTSPLAAESFLQSLHKRWQQDQERSDLADWQRRNIARSLLQYKSETLPLSVQQNLRRVLAHSAEDYLNLASAWIDAQQPDKALSELEQAAEKDSESVVVANRILTLAAKVPNATSVWLGLLPRFPQVVSETLHQLPLAEQGALKEKLIECLQVLQQQALLDAMQADLLFELLIETGRQDAALNLIQHALVRLELRVCLADSLEQSDPENSLRLKQQAVIELLQKGMTKADQQAAHLLMQIEQQLANEALFTSWVESIRAPLRQRPACLKHYRSLVAT